MTTRQRFAGLRRAIDRFESAHLRTSRWNVGDLPSWRSLLVFPTILLAGGIVLISLSLNGSSSGAMRELVASGPDSDLVAGSPVQIRTDEWFVQTVWAISQVEQGLPIVNETFPGGMDATIPQDLPRRDWSVAFRPHLLGFNFLELDQAAAWKWWIPGLALLAAAYVFAVTVIPRRPVVAAALSTGFFFSPLLQWWYLPTTLWPLVWGLTVMSAIVWGSRSARASSWVWSPIIAYLTVVMAMGIYVPYILPIVVVVFMFAVASLVASIRRGEGTRRIVNRFLPLAVAGIVGGAVTGLWLFDKREVVGAFLGTAYPGDRVTPTGASDAVSFAMTISSSFTQSLDAGGLFKENPSEASTVFLIGAFLIPVVAWIVVREWRTRSAWVWPLAGLSGSLVVIAAFLHIPGWDGLAHLLFLDLMTGNRARIGLALASIATIPFIIDYLDKTQSKAPRVLSIAVSALFLLSQTAIAVLLFFTDRPALAASTRWVIYAALGAVAIYFFARSKPVIASVSFLVLTIAGAITVNPVYRGVYDLRESEIGRAVAALDAVRDYRWVGIGDRLTTAVLVETGVRAYNGFQGVPSPSMWDAIDPASQYEYQWNRLAGVSWVSAAGEPVVSNPVADQISVTFDGCSSFAQNNVDFVLTDRPRLDDPCLVPIESFDVTKGALTIYRVR